MIKKISTTMFLIIAILIIIISLVISSTFMYNLIILKSPDNKIAGYSFFTVVGNSMSPEFNAGDVIVVKDISKDEISVGDIVTFNNNGIIVTHRIIEIEEEVFSTQGDNNKNKDSYNVGFDNILGKYILKIPNGDNILYVMKSPLFLIIVFILFLAVLTLLFRIVLGKN